MAQRGCRHLPRSKPALQVAQTSRLHPHARQQRLFTLHPSKEGGPRNETGVSSAPSAEGGPGIGTAQSSAPSKEGGLRNRDEA